VARSIRAVGRAGNQGRDNTGAFNKGGSVAAAGGLLFIGASYDQRLHAYESRTGKLLWGKNSK
jgi:quinoprotein glucose dehydrogenase